MICLPANSLEHEVHGEWTEIICFVIDVDPNEADITSIATEKNLAVYLDAEGQWWQLGDNKIRHHTFITGLVYTQEN